MCYHKLMSNLPNDDQTQPVIPTSSKGKELDKGGQPFDSAQGQQEVTPITEYTRNVDLEPEVEGWLEKLEKEQTQLGQPVTDDKGQVILEDANKQQSGFKVVLPLTKDEVEKGLHHKVIDSIRWLAEWCIRMIKMFGNKVTYRRS